jgi:hypothetical protein
VGWDREDVNVPGGLRDMIDSGRSVTRATFRRNVGADVLKNFESMMGYPFGKLTMAKDYAVSYSRGKLHGRRVYWVNHSAIEYVFVPEDFQP